MARHILTLLFCGTLYWFIVAEVSAEEYIEIPSVTIKAPKRSKSILDGRQKVTITAQEIKQMGASAVAQVLDGYAGVQIYDLTGDYSQAMVSIRGFGDNAGSNSLILIDGQPWRNPDVAVPELSSIMLSQIAAIEVIPGSRGVEYGDQAVGGVINIITRKPKPHGVNVAMSGGSYNQYGLNVGLSHVYANGFSLMLNGLKKHTDNYRHHNDFDQINLAGQIGYDYSSGSIKLNYQIIDTNQLLAGALTAEQVDEDRQQAINNTDFTKQRTQIVSLGIKQNLAHDWRLIAHTLYRKTNGDGFLGGQFGQDRRVIDLLPRVTGKLGKMHITSGFDLESDHYQLASLFGINQATQQERSVFARLIYPLNTKLYISGGSRLATLSGNLLSQGHEQAVSGRAFVNEVGLNYRFTRAIEFFLRRDGNYRFPKSDENSNTPKGVIGLATQTGVSYETGLSIHVPNLKGSLSFYQLNLNNEIAFDPENTPLQPYGANRNLEPTTRNGVTFSLNYLVGAHGCAPLFRINTEYSYVDARFSEGANTGKRIPFVASNVFRLGTHYYFAKDWNFYAEGLYTGSRYPSNDDKNQAALIGGYTVYNANLSHRIKLLTLSMRINNIFNKIYNAYTLYTPSTQTNAYYPALGRNFLLTAEYAIS